MFQPAPRRLLTPAALLMAGLFSALSISMALAQQSVVVSPPGVRGDNPNISADGRTVGYLEAFSGTLYLVNADGSNLTSAGITSVGHFELSRDGRLAVFTHASSLHGPWPHVDLIDTATLQLTTLSGSISGWMPSISGDGSTVTFTDINLPELYAVDSDGANLRMISGTIGTAQGGSSVNADGSVVVFDGWDIPSVSSINIYKLNTDGTGLTQLTFDEAREDVRARLSDDGTLTTAEIFRDGIHAVNTDGTGALEIGNGWDAFWSGEENDLSDLSGDGSVAVVSTGGSVFVAGTDGSMFRFLPAGGREVAINGRGDLVTHSRWTGSTFEIRVSGVPGQSPGEMFDIGFEPDGQTLSWITTPAAFSHNLYRTDIAGSGAVAPGSSGICVVGSILGGTTVEASAPPLGQAYGLVRHRRERVG